MQKMRMIKEKEEDQKFSRKPAMIIKQGDPKR
jgi:hypothetical protein